MFQIIYFSLRVNEPKLIKSHGNDSSGKFKCKNKVSILINLSIYWCSLASLVAGTSRICLQYERPGFNPRIRKIPWRREWQTTLVFLPGESHGQRSLVGYSPWGHKESDMTERLHFTLRVSDERMKWSSHHGQQKSPKCSTWMQTKKRKKDLCLVPR